MILVSYISLKIVFLHSLNNKQHKNLQLYICYTWQWWLNAYVYLFTIQNYAYVTKLLRDTLDFCGCIYNGVQDEIVVHVH